MNWPAILARFRVVFYFPIELQLIGPDSIVFWAWWLDGADGRWKWFPQPLPLPRVSTDAEAFAWLGEVIDRLLVHERQEWTWIDGRRVGGREHREAGNG